MEPGNKEAINTKHSPYAALGTGTDHVQTLTEFDQSLLLLSIVPLASLIIVRRTMIAVNTMYRVDDKSFILDSGALACGIKRYLSSENIASVKQGHETQPKQPRAG